MKKLPIDIIILHMCTKNHGHMLYCSWDMVCDRCNCYILFWAIFCPFTPLTAQKIKISKKWKKLLKISSFYICVPKIIIRWCAVPEIWCMMDVIIFHFGPFFCTFTPLQAKKIKIKKKIKKKRPWDIIILHKCAKNHDHMLHCYWDMVHDRWNYFSFWAIFCHLPPLQLKKSKFYKNEKKAWPYHHFTYVYQKLWSNDVWFLRYGVPRMDGRTDRWAEIVTYRGGCNT